jgi:anti-sigma factor ChrR (cupin superfamily)
VGLTHARRGNTTGAARLLRRAADRIEPYSAAGPHGVPVVGLAAWARSAADTIERGDGDVPEEALTPTLIDGPVLKLLRWQESGAVWRVVSSTDSDVVVSLLTCTAGEEVERVRSADPALRAFLGDRLSSELD